MNTMMLGVVVALTVPLAGTTLGSALAFFMKKQISTLFQKALLGWRNDRCVGVELDQPCDRHGS